MNYKNVIACAKINQIRLREPLEMLDAGQMLHILINYMVIRHTLTY